MSTRFVTLFPQAKNVHFRKGVGQIPYTLHRDYNVDATLVCFQNEQHYPSLQNDVPGLKLSFLPSKYIGSPLIASLKYILGNAKSIDVLNLYGQSRWSFCVGLLYKMLNRKGLLYLKLDMNVQYLQNLMEQKNTALHLFMWNFYFKRILNFVSSEYIELSQLLTEFYAISNSKIIQLPNGVNDIAISKLPFNRKSFIDKENIILFVGRVGLKEKNNEMLLTAASKIELKDWKVFFVGPIEPEFEPKINQFHEDNKGLSDKVFFVGEVIDFASLCNWYNRAKIFCLTSSREGFPVVIPEAMYWGNYIVCTDVSSIKEALDYGALGSIVSDEKELVNTLQSLINDEISMKEITERSIAKAEQEYIWTKLVAKIYDRINNEIR